MVSKVLYRLDRLYHMIYAYTHAYFWLPCGICGRKFGGHEKGNGYLQTSDSGGETVCSNCATEGYRRTGEYIFSDLNQAVRDDLSRPQTKLGNSGLRFTERNDE